MSFLYRPSSGLEINSIAGRSWGKLHFLLSSANLLRNRAGFFPHFLSSYQTFQVLGTIFFPLRRRSTFPTWGFPVGPCLCVAITSSGLLRSVLQADSHWDCEQVVDKNVSLHLSHPALPWGYSKYWRSNMGSFMWDQRLKLKSDSY